MSRLRIRKSEANDRAEKRKIRPLIFKPFATMPQILNLVLLLSAVSLASFATCHPAETDNFDVIQRAENPPLLDFPLLSSKEAAEEFPELSQSGFGNTDPLLLTSLSGPPASTTFALENEFDPTWLSDPDSSPLSLQIADGKICPGDNRYAFCCKGEKCILTAECYSDEDLNCCTVDPGNNDDKNPYDCQPPSASLPQNPQSIHNPSSISFSQLPDELDSGVSEDFLSEVLNDFPNDVPQGLKFSG